MDGGGGMLRHRINRTRPLFGNHESPRYLLDKEGRNQGVDLSSAQHTTTCHGTLELDWIEWLISNVTTHAARDCSETRTGVRWRDD
jgi:hypothetical protein